MKKNLQKLFFSLGLVFSINANDLQAQATLVSQFDFNGNLNDKLSVSTASLYNNSNTAYVNGALTFTANTTSNGGGLLVSVPDASFTESNYSIAMDVNFSTVTGYRKLIDFFDMNDDDGFYFNTSYLTLYYGGNNLGSTALNANTFYTILMTRNGIDDTARAYVVQNNSLLYECKVKDLSAKYTATLVGTDRKLGFFHDDCCSEYPDSGAVRSIRIWNGIVNINDVCNGVANYTMTPSNLILCNGTSGSLIFGNSPDPAFTTYTFNPLGTTSSTAVISPSVSTTYTLLGDYYSTSCNTPSSSISVTVAPNPTVTAVTSTSILCLSNTATLTASGATTYTWNTASTNTSIAVSPTVTTSYTVTGANAFGCTASSTVTQTVSACTGINSLEVNSTIVNVSPNPNNGRFNVILNHVNANVILEIYNAIGELIYEKKAESSIETLDISDFSNGVYFVKVKENSNQISVSKIIKN